MKSLTFLIFIVAFLAPRSLFAVEVAPNISDREIVERLTRLEEGQNHLRDDVKHLREEMNARFAAIDTRFVSIDARFTGMEAGMNAQFDRLANILMAIVAAFAAVTASTIGFAIWDRRTMIRPFESKVKAMEEAFAENRQQVHALIESMKTLSQRDESVADVLRKFHLL